MTRKNYIVPTFSLFLIIVTSNYSSAQFINLQITIEPELSAQVEQPLTFGQMISNSGIQEIEIGDLNMGVFSIRAIRSQSLFLELNHPNALTSRNNNGELIPLDLEIAYSNNGSNNVSDAQVLTNKAGAIKIANSNNNSGSYWRILYVYVYGAIDVGNIPNGIYTGDVTLFVNYD